MKKLSFKAGQLKLNRLRKNQATTNAQYFLNGLLEGLAVALFLGPVFIVTLVCGWLGLTVIISLCFVTYKATSQAIQKKYLISGTGRSELYWLGFTAGFALCLTYMFLVLFFKQEFTSVNYPSL